MASKKHNQDQSWASIDDKIDTSMPDQMRLLSVDCPLFPSRFEFPFKLHCILEDASCQGNEHIISWLPHGRAFKIHSKEAFETEILPKYYTNNRKSSSSSSSSPPKYRSFSRQLAIYGFQLNKKRESFGSPDHGSYRHPLMVRSKPSLCTGMIRQKVKGNRTRKTNKGGHQDEEAGPETQQVVPNPTCEPASSSLVLVTTSEGPRPPNGATAAAAAATGKDNLLEFAILANKFLESHNSSDPAPYLSSTSTNKTAIDGGHHSSSSAFPSSGSSSSSKNPYTNKECWWNNGMLLEEQEEPQLHFGEPLDMNSFFDWSQDESAIYQGIEYLLVPRGVFNMMRHPHS